MPEDINPYEPPSVESSRGFQEKGASVAELERRVAELERRLAQSWFISDNLLSRAFAVLGHFIVAYICVAIIVVPILLLLELLSVPS